MMYIACVGGGTISIEVKRRRGRTSSSVEMKRKVLPREVGTGSSFTFQTEVTGRQGRGKKKKKCLEDRSSDSKTDRLQKCRKKKRRKKTAAATCRFSLPEKGR